MERRVQTLADTISQRQHYVYKTDLNNHNMEVGKFRPNTVVDQNVVIKDNRTPCVKERHSAADLTPALIVFKNVREDGKDCTTLYTDPHYFGRVWFNQMQKAFEANKRARTKKKNKKQNVKKEPRPVIIKEYKVDALGNKIVTENQIRKVDNTLPSQNQQPYDPEFYQTEQDGNNPPPLQPLHIEQGDSMPPPPDFDFPAPLEYEDTYPSLNPPVNEYAGSPAPLTVHQPYDDEVVYDEPVRTNVPRAPAAPQAPAAPRAPPAPAAPRAPPAPAAPKAPPVPVGGAVPRAPQPPNAGLQRPKHAPAPPAEEPRNFLNDIQQYSINTLKKAPKPEPKPEHHYASMDVMSILSRRLVMQSSDTSDSGSDSSDQDWDGDE
ncbi:actin-binding protein WASF2-like isoform X1 [Bolinopsis microptera]|uniref:actin-binding protein WASF2-like isoform X1 n=1 Tax=Bolinopsis microptera TaxID=2820187 RepID=UPI003079324D